MIQRRINSLNKLCFAIWADPTHLKLNEIVFQ